MHVTSLRLNSFRCFSEKVFRFNKRIVLIEGENGSGKSTLFEGLHYACHLKSFRTSRAKDICAHQSDNFFVTIDLHNKTTDEDHRLHAGFSRGEKAVTLNKKKVTSYKNIIDLYRVVTMAENDLDLIQEGPGERRAFLNQFLLLLHPECAPLLRQYKHIMQQRLSVLLAYRHPTDEALSSLDVWTRQLWDLSRTLASHREEIAALLERRVNSLLEAIDHPLRLSLAYERKRYSSEESYESFWEEWKGHSVNREFQMKRTLFGAHLDDLSILFGGKSARIFASRGQQKLLVLLFKIAQIEELQERLLSEEHEGGIVLVLDDFITDFDDVMAKRVLQLLGRVTCQLFLSCPLESRIDFPAEFHDEIEVIKL